MVDSEGNRDPRCFWQADLDEAARPPDWLVRIHQPDVMTTYNAFGGYGHPDHIRTHDVGVRAFERAGDPAWYQEQLEGTGLSVWAPAKLYDQPCRPRSGPGYRSVLRERASARSGNRRRMRRPEQIAEFEAYSAKMLVPDESITTWVDIAGDPLEAKWAAIHERVTQISDDSPFMLLGLDGWRDGWGREAYILRESRIESALPETDLVRRDSPGRPRARGLTTAAGPSMP